VASNEKLYSRRDVTQARRARDLEARMGFTPAEKLKSLLNAGSIIECPVTSRDITIAEKVYGVAYQDSKVELPIGNLKPAGTLKKA